MRWIEREKRDRRQIHDFTISEKGPVKRKGGRRTTYIDRGAKRLAHAFDVIAEGPLERQPEMIQRAGQVCILQLRRRRERADQRSRRVISCDLRRRDGGK